MGTNNILITGGAGFIGTNVAEYYLSKGHKVVIIDNLKKVGSETNIEYLLKNFRNLIFYKKDIVINQETINDVISESDVVFHLAAQVATTTSIKDPRDDLLSNIIGTFNILESLRLFNPKALLIYSSTNKVYGDLNSSKIISLENRYDLSKPSKGISEETRLNFNTPYSCSKGSADQYVSDYAKTYGLNTVVFRQSCIYGPRQLGTEDQGWVAWFVIAALNNIPVKIYGDGKQVRDLLYISDLIKAYNKVINCKGNHSGETFNIGGGINNKASIIEVIKLIEDISGKKIDYSYSDWRSGDQKVYVSDISKISKSLGWEPTISISNGIKTLIDYHNNR